jgi:D-glycerate 3-kinase
MIINEVLRAYEAAWDSHVDAWLVVKVGSPDWVYSWRLQAEHAMRASGRPGMSDDQVVNLWICPSVMTALITEIT